MIRAVLFDWGDTLMRDFPDQTGPMADWPHVEALPGAYDLLAGLQGRYRLALATNAADSGEAKVREALRRVGLEGHFELILTAREAGVAKPMPGFFRAALEKLGVQAAEAVMVGDSWLTDVEGAKSVGLRTVWLNPRNRTAPSGAADAVVARLEDVREAIARLDAPRERG